MAHARSVTHCGTGLLGRGREKRCPELRQQGIRLKGRTTGTRPLVAHHGRGDEERARRCGHGDGDPTSFLADATEVRILAAAACAGSGYCANPQAQEGNRRRGEHGVHDRRGDRGGALGCWVHVGLRPVREDERTARAGYDHERRKRDAND
jgi:hypothetical protein